MRVKICGITSLEDAMRCTDAGADALGFIFYEKSPRFLEPEQAAEIIRRLPPLVQTVGVFVDAPPETVNHVARTCRLGAVQLHGDESPEYADRIEHPVIKAFRVGPGFDYAAVRDFEDHSVLLDAWSGSGFGGTGQRFDWYGIPEELRRACILAGGIGIDNICDVVADIKPAAVDVSSSVESEPGRKDPVKVREFFKRMRDCPA